MKQKNKWQFETQNYVFFLGAILIILSTICSADSMPEGDWKGTLTSKDSSDDLSFTLNTTNEPAPPFYISTGTLKGTYFQPTAVYNTDKKIKLTVPVSGIFSYCPNMWPAQISIECTGALKVTKENYEIRYAIEGSGTVDGATATGDYTLNSEFRTLLPLGKWQSLDVTSGTFSVSLQLPPQATNPFPTDGDSNQPLNIELSWSEVPAAYSYDIYFGEDWGTISTFVFRGNQTGTSFDPGPLDQRKTYCWRIDTVNATGTAKGTVWRFKTPYVIYVDDDAPEGGNGSSWSDAHSTLQDALNEAEATKSKTQIWVRKGIYRPTEGNGRFKRFSMQNNLAIYGGFAGKETALEQRDVLANKTVLSGDLAGNDGPHFSTLVDNCYNVFCHPEETNLDSTAILDGFTITGGFANYSFFPQNSGGGMNNGYNGDVMSDVPSTIHPTIRNCTFEGNLARKDGGGMFDGDYSESELINCIFRNNRALRGGGVFSDNTATFIENCTFEDNLAYDYGGGIYKKESCGVVKNCIFTNNTSEGSGGGISYDNSSAWVTNCTFTNNTALYGGGISNYYTNGRVIDCTFNGNVATYRGGGIESDTFSSTDVGNCIFMGNIAADGGGIYSRHYSNLTADNCIFSGNTASRQGGGIYSKSYCVPRLTNCTFSDNVASNGGGIANVEYSTKASVTNCILWGNAPDQIYNSNSIPTISNCDIAGCLDGGVWDANLGTDNGGNMDESPLFCRMPNDGGDGWGDNPDTEEIDESANDDYGHLQLQSGSPCIDAANGTLARDTDILGNPRYDDPSMENIGVGSPSYVDIGAYEYQGTITLLKAPSVINLYQDVAHAMIASTGLLVGAKSYEYSEMIPAGYVIRQTSSSDQLLASGSSIDLVISKGPGTIVPDATGKTEAEAEALILDSNLSVGEVTYHYDENVPEGNVIAQSPTAGTTVPLGSSVDLNISLGNFSESREGCTSTFWRTNPNQWSDEYRPTILISNVFTSLQRSCYANFADDKCDFDTDTLLDTLNYSGGRGLEGAVRNLLRHATAALLNAANGNVDYPIDESLVIELTNRVLDTEDVDFIQELHSVLAEFNEYGCPMEN